MEVIVHPGAHRTGGASLRTYLDEVGGAPVLWGPADGRRLFGAPVPGGPLTTVRRRARAAGRARLAAARAAATGAAQLLLSDPALLGPLAGCLAEGRLYPEAGLRMARVAEGLRGYPSRVVLVIRALDDWWRSVIAAEAVRGAPLPDAAASDRLVTAPRRWRQVVTDIACAWPEAEVCVLPFESVAGWPEHFLAAAGLPVPRDVYPRPWCNRGPDRAALAAALAEQGRAPGAISGEGRWQPFDPDQRAALRALHAEDLAWLRAGAEGLARYIDHDRGADPAPKDKGHGHDGEDGDLAQARRERA
jgi:hypothetical protein